MSNIDDILSAACLFREVSNGNEDLLGLFDKIYLAKKLETDARNFRLQVECDECPDCAGCDIIPTAHDPRDPAFGEVCKACHDRQQAIRYT